ncbi:MAG: penicillin-binding protein 2 [Alphaproteobacteria bacterium]|nr:penicillin-binding protein 2 [Alphaproteobacteria bacterium]
MLFRNSKRKFIYPGQEIDVSQVSSRKSILHISRNRLFICAFVFLLSYLLLAVRLAYVSIPYFTGYYGEIVKYKSDEVINADRYKNRVDIVDKDGLILSTNLPTVNLYADPKYVIEPELTAKELVKIFPDLEYEKLYNRLTSNQRFIYIKRGLTPKEQFKVNTLGLYGLNYEKGENRAYLQGNLFSHIIGYVGVDNNGLAGIERYLDKILYNEDAIGDDVGIVKVVDGRKSVRLSIKSGVQDTVKNVLQKSIDEFKAIGGVVIIMDVHTGEVISMVSLPDYDPNSLAAIKDPDNQMLNRSTLGVYEVGSIFKVFSAATALDAGIANMDSTYDASKPLKFSRFYIRDFHAQGREMSLPEVLIYSSNIATAKMMLEAGEDIQKEYLRKFGFFDRLKFELPERAKPLYPRTWRDVNTATISYGHGISVSPLHVVAAMSAMVNGGIYHNPTIFAKSKREIDAVRRVISEETSRDVRKLMSLVVQKGSGKKANVEGYDVGGKTGTAQKVVDGKYVEGLVLTSFSGAFPMRNPKYAFMVMLDEPQKIKKTKNYNAAGWNAAPATANIIREVAPLLGIEPKIDVIIPKSKPKHFRR